MQEDGSVKLASLRLGRKAYEVTFAYHDLHSVRAAVEKLERAGDQVRGLFFAIAEVRAGTPLRDSFIEQM